MKKIVIVFLFVPIFVCAQESTKQIKKEFDSILSISKNREKIKSQNNIPPLKDSISYTNNQGISNILTAPNPEDIGLRFDDDITVSQIINSARFYDCTGNDLELKTCFNKKIQTLFQNRFNYDLADGLYDSKTIKIYIEFDISEEGAIINPSAVMRPTAKLLDLWKYIGEALHPYYHLEQEALRVLLQIPDVIPATDSLNKPVTSSYSTYLVLRSANDAIYDGMKSLVVEDYRMDPQTKKEQVIRSSTIKTLIYHKKEGNLKYDLGSYKKSVKAYNKALDVIRNTNSLYFSSDSWLIDIYYNRGLAKAQLKKYKKAIKDFDKAIELSRKGITGTYDDIIIKSQLEKKLLFLAHFNRADAKYSLKKFESACKDWEIALEIAEKKFESESLNIAIFDIQSVISANCISE